MVGLYLYDSAMLLASNEALLSPARKGKWRASFGADHFHIRGKEPFLPNPLLPHRPLYRFFWNTEGLVGPSQPWTPPSGNRYAILIPFIWAMLASLFVLIPLGLFSPLGDLAVAIGILLFYANALMALALVWFNREGYGINGKRFAGLAFESLTCPPFALNLVRHLSLGLRPRTDFLSVAGQYLSGIEYDATLAKAIFRIESELDWEGEDTPRGMALNAHRQYLIHEWHSSQACSEAP